MRKKFIFMVLVFGFISINLYAQSNEQRLVGTWTNLNGIGIITFNSDGTYSSNDIFTGWTRWVAAGNSLILYSGDNKILRRFQISTDGRTLILEEPANAQNAFAFRRGT